MEAWLWHGFCSSGGHLNAGCTSESVSDAFWDAREPRTVLHYLERPRALPSVRQRRACLRVWACSWLPRIWNIDAGRGVSFWLR